MDCNCNGMTEYDGAWVGGILKYKVEITAEGFSMEDDEFSVEVSRGSKSIIFEKPDMLIHEVETEVVVPGSGSGEGTTETVVETEYYIAIDTEVLGAGQYVAITRAYVPDDDVEGGVRVEITKQNLIPVRSL